MRHNIYYGYTWEYYGVHEIVYGENKNVTVKCGERFTKKRNVLSHY